MWCLQDTPLPQVPFCPHHVCDVVSYSIICDQNEKFLFKPDPITAMLPPLSLMVLLFIDLEMFLSPLKLDYSLDISDQVDDPVVRASTHRPQCTWDENGTVRKILS